MTDPVTGVAIAHKIITSTLVKSRQGDSQGQKVYCERRFEKAPQPATELF
jgi:hypothetical protein